MKTRIAYMIDGKPFLEDQDRGHRLNPEAVVKLVPADPKTDSEVNIKRELVLMFPRVEIQLAE